MLMFSTADEERIAQAIHAAEAHTSGEIVAVVAERSGGYLLFSLLWAALIALLVPWPLIFFTWWPMQWVYGLQIVVFLVLALLLSAPQVAPMLVPQSVKRKWAHRRAVEQFLSQNMHTTAGRTGVMIFVSVEEHYAEVLADIGIYEKVPKGEWQAIIDTLTAAIAAGRAADGFVAAIERSGAHLARHFPPDSIDRNELPNHLIVLR
jgi:putative membrane protein